MKEAIDREGSHEIIGKYANTASVYTLDSISLNAGDLAHTNYGFVAEYIWSRTQNKHLLIFRKHIKRLVNVCICVQYLGFCCVYAIFMSKNFKTVSNKKQNKCFVMKIILAY